MSLSFSGSCRCSPGYFRVFSKFEYLTGKVFIDVVNVGNEKAVLTHSRFHHFTNYGGEANRSLITSKRPVPFLLGRGNISKRPIEGNCAEI